MDERYFWPSISANSLFRYPMSAYRCPSCGEATRDSDKTNKDGKLVVRTIVYDCGTIMKVIQDGFRYRHNVKTSEKCVESKPQSANRKHG